MGEEVQAGARLSTADRIVEAGRLLFNAKGFAATTLTEIAASLGMSQGNLTYHFPTRLDLVLRIQAEAQSRVRAHRALDRPVDLAQAYVSHLLFTARLSWDFSFLMRDRHLFGVDLDNSEIEAIFDEFRYLLSAIDAAGMFRKGAVEELPLLARSLWIISRYWLDHLREKDGQTDFGWQDTERGARHHIGLLLPCLTAPARRELETALEAGLRENR